MVRLPACAAGGDAVAAPADRDTNPCRARQDLRNRPGRTRHGQRRTAAAQPPAGAITRTGTARHCPSGTTGVLEGPNGPWRLPPACIAPPRPGAGRARRLTAAGTAAAGRSADSAHGLRRGTAAPGQPGDLIPADAIGLGLRQRPGNPRRVSWVTHHCCTRPSPSLMTSWQACIDPGANRTCPATITPQPVRCHRTNHPIPASATVKGTCPVPGSRVTHPARARSPPAGPGADHRQESPRSYGDRSPRRRRGSL